MTAVASCSGFSELQPLPFSVYPSHSLLTDLVETSSDPSVVSISPGRVLTASCRVSPALLHCTTLSSTPTMPPVTLFRPHGPPLYQVNPCQGNVAFCPLCWQQVSAWFALSAPSMFHSNVSFTVILTLPTPFLILFFSSWHASLTVLCLFLVCCVTACLSH